MKNTERKMSAQLIKSLAFRIIALWNIFWLIVFAALSFGVDGTILFEGKILTSIIMSNLMFTPYLVIILLPEKNSG